MKYAPIYITTLCRHEHFKRCIESLKSNSWASYTDVFIALDYPPSEKYRSGWERIKKYLRDSDFSVFASFNVIERETNYGSSGNSGAMRDYILSLGYDRWIYSDDDIEFSPIFLEYIDKCLDYYEDDASVVGVTGFSYPVKWNVSAGATCFKQKFNASTWGTGFWKSKREPIMDYLTNRGLKKALPKVLKYKLYEDMIDTAKIEYFREAFSVVHYLKKNWMRTTSDMALRAYLAIENKYYITPVISKTRNHGFDGSGANCERSNKPSTYDIDNSDTFILVDDQLNDYRGNMQMMNKREVKSNRDMIRTWTLIWIANHFGTWFSIFFTLLLVPYDMFKVFIHKFI